MPPCPTPSCRTSSRMKASAETAMMVSASVGHVRDLAPAEGSTVSPLVSACIAMPSWIRVIPQPGWPVPVLRYAPLVLPLYSSRVRDSRSRIPDQTSIERRPDAHDNRPTKVDDGSG